MKKALIVLLVLVILGLFYFLFRDQINLKKSKKNEVFLSASEAEELEVDPLNRTKVLKLGSSGAEVLQLQLLINNGLDMNAFTLENLSLDGDFGPKTENALVMVYGLDEMNLVDAENSARLLGYIS